MCLVLLKIETDKTMIIHKLSKFCLAKFYGIQNLNMALKSWHKCFRCTFDMMLSKIVFFCDQQNNDFFT